VQLHILARAREQSAGVLVANWHIHNKDETMHQQLYCTCFSLLLVHLLDLINNAKDII
jgi:hypothetical protein